MVKENHTINKQVDAAIEADKVVFSYNGKSNALRGLDLTIKRGEFVAILGPNGSGKSTFARQLNALTTPDSGKILVLGYNTKDESLTFKIRSSCGLVFQDPDNQIVASVVEDDVAFGPENLGLPPYQIRERVNSALSAVGMQQRAKKNPANLSGGQKQRVVIADVLALNPEIIVFDEPCAMLDLRGRRGIHRICKELHARGKTIILITQFMQEAVMADRVVVLNCGRVALNGTPEEVFMQKEHLESLGLEVPLAITLANDLKSKGIDVKPAFSLDELKEELCRLYSTR